MLKSHRDRIKKDHKKFMRKRRRELRRIERRMERTAYNRKSKLINRSDKKCRVCSHREFEYSFCDIKNIRVDPMKLGCGDFRINRRKKIFRERFKYIFT